MSPSGQGGGPTESKCCFSCPLLTADSHRLSLCCTELLKDVSKSTGPARARGPRGRRRRPGDEEAGTAPELQAASVGTCQGLLRAILTHWAPVVPGPEPVDGAAPERRAAGPEHTVASLAASWALRSVAGCPPDAAEAEGLLGWLEKHILPRPAVVAELLADGTAVTSLFGLYTRLCGADVLAGPSLGVACQFNAIMLRLLAARGLAGSPVHGAIEGLCCSSLHEGEETATRGESEPSRTGREQPSQAHLGFLEKLGDPGAVFRGLGVCLWGPE